MGSSGTIVCGLGQAHQEAVLVRAYSLALERGLSVRLVHVVGLPSTLFRHGTTEALDAARERAFERLAPALERALPGLDARTALERDLCLRSGSPAEALLEEAARAGAERIVIGPHERAGVLDFFGNTTRALLASATCPVWIEPRATAPPASPRTVRRVLAAVALGPAGRATIALAREEARAFGAELELVHVFELPYLGTAFGYTVPLPPSALIEARDTAQREFRELVASFEWRDAGDPPRPLAQEAHCVDGIPAEELLRRSSAADLLVLSGAGHGPVHRALVGSVAAELVRRSERPVLAQRIPSGAG